VIGPELGHVRIDQLGPRHIDIWMGHLLSGEGRQFANPEKQAKATRNGAKLAKLAKLAPRSVIRHRAVLSAALGKAVDWGWLDKNPCERSDPPPVASKAMAEPTIEQVSDLLATAWAKNTRWAILLLLALVTGARHGWVVTTNKMPWCKDRGRRTKRVQSRRRGIYA
jgi:hypothetical protein